MIQDDKEFSTLKQKSEALEKSEKILTQLVGIVVDKDGNGISGAAVIRKSNSFGVSTAYNGAYSMLVSSPVTDTLVVSQIGYITTEKEIVVPAGGGIYVVPNIVLHTQ